MSQQFSGSQEFYPSRSGGTLAADRKAATGLVYQQVVAGVLSTVAVQGDTGALIAIQATGLATDQIIINAAIVYINGLGGGSLFIEQGDYTIAASIIPTGPIRIYGAGAETTIDGGNLAHVFDINALWDVYIDHLALRTNPGGITVFNPINITGNSLRIFISMIFILASDNDGIAIADGVIEVFIHDVLFTTIDNYPINCDGDDCCIRHNHFSGAIGNDAIFLDVNSDGNMVEHNHIHAWTGEPVDDDGNNIVDGNICCAVGAPVAAWNSKGCGFATIQACIDHQAGSGSIDIEPGTFTVAGGVISLDAADSSLRIRGAGMVVTTLSSSAGTCLDINAAVNIQIEDLSVETTGVGANDALVVRGASGIIHLTRIACSDAGQDAVSIAAAAGFVFMEALDLSAPGAAGIARYGVNVAGDNCKLSLSRINNTGDDGIWLQAGGTYCIVIANRISGWVGEAIDDDEPTNQVAHNITVV